MHPQGDDLSNSRFLLRRVFRVYGMICFDTFNAANRPRGFSPGYGRLLLRKSESWGGICNVRGVGGSSIGLPRAGNVYLHNFATFSDEVNHPRVAFLVPRVHHPYIDSDWKMKRVRSLPRSVAD